MQLFPTNLSNKENTKNLHAYAQKLMISIKKMTVELE